MESIPSSNNVVTFVESQKSEIINSASFVQYQYSDPEFQSLESEFFPLTGSAIEYTQNQINTLNPSSSFSFYQIPFSQRGYGIIPNTLKISVNNFYSITDDGNGNLYNNNQIIGNVFYNSGVIFITNSGSFSGSVINYQDLSSGSNYANFSYYRNVEFMENKLYLNIESTKYINSSNSTFSGSASPYTALSKIYLYNDNNDIIGVASFNKIVILKQDLFVILDLIESL